MAHSFNETCRLCFIIIFLIFFILINDVLGQIVCFVMLQMQLMFLMDISAFVQLMVPFQEDSAVLVEENTDIPDYLPEEESPSQEQDKAVTRVGSITDGMGWLSTAANFLTRSFYW